MKADSTGEVLLTGATGFIGSFLLADLLDRTSARVHCLVRARDEEEGAARLATALASARPGRSLPADRVVAVPGDLEKPGLGVCDERFHRLAAAVEAVYHCGAFVNFAYPYATLKPTNVGGTQEVIRLASAGRRKPLHHVSTLRALGSLAGSDGTALREDAALDHDGVLFTGYAQSKWVAEKIVGIARARGLAASVYRPGMVAGDTRTGVSNLDDLLCRMIKGCVQLGSAPVLDMMVDATPVDFVSAAIVELSLQPRSLGKTFHLVTTEPVPWNAIVGWVRGFGYPLRALSYDGWRAELLEATRRSGDNALAPLVHFFPEGMALPFAGRFDCRNTTEGLAGTALACPPASAEVLATYLSYFVRSGFLEPPRSASAGLGFTTRDETEVCDGAR
jgi:thioester reductase-like protein